MLSLGFSNVIVSDNNFDDEHLKHLFSFLVDRGFRRIIFAVDHDVSTTPLSLHLEYKKSLFETISKCKPRGISVWLESNIIMSHDSIYESQISRLSIKKTNYLLTSFPIFDYGDWIDSTLNYLLYKQKKSPCFISFERNILTYPDEFVRHLISTRCSCFMLDLNSFAVPKVIPYINDLINANAVIVPGICGVLNDYTALDDKLSYFRGKIGRPNYTKLLVNSSKSSKLLLGL